MSQNPFSSGKLARGFSVPIFAIVVLSSLGITLLAFYLVVPEWLWVAQISASWKAIVVTFLAVNLHNCFLEYFFHRYVLHKTVIQFFRAFYKAHHLIHHPLTRIKKKRVRDGREILVLVENDYPFTRPEQNESSIFPWYTFFAFVLVLTPLFALLQWLMPALPWFLVGYCGLAWSLTLYEGFHYIEHLPLEKWLPLIDHPRFGEFWTKVYGFHLFHHAETGSNEAISGFFLFPLADKVFRTLETPKTLFPTGEKWDQTNFWKSNPVWLIRWLDEWVKKVESKRRNKSRVKIAA